MNTSRRIRIINHTLEKIAALEKEAGAMRDFATGAVKAHAAGKATPAQLVASKLQSSIRGIAQKNAWRREAMASGNLPEAAMWAGMKQQQLHTAKPAIAAWKDLVAKNRAARKTAIW